MQRKTVLGLILVGVLSVFGTVIYFLPASWVGILLERQTLGRVSLGDIQGSFWQGSAFLGVAVDRSSPLTPLFPGRFSWKISPALLLGQVAVHVENNAAMSAPLRITGNLHTWQISPASIRLPPERLEGFGAPLNTIGPTGKINLRWGALNIERAENALMLVGNMHLELQEMASRISSIRPLGSYDLNILWRGDSAEMQLSTTVGPLMLEGLGGLKQGRFQFTGKAFADKGQEEKMANLLNLLGRRRFDGDKQFIALEYK
ncbi:type II secretion system protein N [Undibacterium fentianense]|uniref:Type II secretion system protein N n=1 Tax=Undibacterium fentianense TaxID=2828728 RepID=A0A941DZA8_9BURK|nr:type II secretion system protein N [Undibacterium fentianense]MBR7798411.1 type II secretion system protein N [Undibacterium fentianense]